MLSISCLQKIQWYYFFSVFKNFYMSAPGTFAALYLYAGSSPITEGIICKFHSKCSPYCPFPETTHEGKQWHHTVPVFLCRTSLGAFFWWDYQQENYAHSLSSKQRTTLYSSKTDVNQDSPYTLSVTGVFTHIVYARFWGIWDTQLWL